MSVLDLDAYRKTCAPAEYRQDCSGMSDGALTDYLFARLMGKHIVARPMRTAKIFRLSALQPDREPI